MNNNLTVLACATLLVMAGCAKKMDESAEMAASDAGAGMMAAEPVAADASEVQNAVNPEQLVSDRQSMLEQSRQLVKSAQLNFEVGDIQKTTQAIEKQLLQINGYVESKSVDYQIEDYRARAKLDGTVDVFEKILPTAELTIRVPNQQVTAFLNGLLPLMKNFNQQYYEAKRYELKLLQESISSAQQTAGTFATVNNQVQRLTQLEVQDRLQFSTITIRYYQTPQLRQRQDINLQRVANLHSDPFLARIWQSAKMGLIGIREVILWLVMIWPAYVMIAVIIVALRLRRRARNKDGIE